MGSKYVFKPDSNPGAGHYDTDAAMKHVKPKKYEAFMVIEKKPEKAVDDTPDAGIYHKNEDFNRLKNKVSMGAKYEFKADSNPPVGGYDVDAGHAHVQGRSQSALIRGPVSSYRRPKENLPGAGHYDGHLKSIGASIKTNVNMGSKYVFKPDSNPGAGYYDPDQSVN